MGEALSSRAALRLGAAVAIAYGLSVRRLLQPHRLPAHGELRPGLRGLADELDVPHLLRRHGDCAEADRLPLPLAPPGMVLVPLSLLFLFVVPVLVGFNVVLSYYALRQSSFPLSGRWLVGSGAVVGLFTACPDVRGPLPCQLDWRDRDDARGGPRPLPAPLRRRHAPGAPRRPAVHRAQREAVLRGHVQGPARARDQRTDSVLDNCLNHHPAADGEV